MKNIQKSFGELAVLKGISLTVSSGEVLAVIGPSGSGKSTLLRCATLLETIDSGSIRYLGEVAACTGGKGIAEYASKQELKKIRQHFGLVFQNFNLFPHFTVLQNVTDAPINVQKREKTEVFKKSLALLNKMGLADKAQSYPFELSGGQQQRVCIVRALAMEPRILFFDEPTSALDPELTGEVLQVIRNLAQEHMTMVIVTHEMAFAAAVADRVLFMDAGSVVEQGAPEEVIKNPKEERTRRFLARYIQQ